MILKHFPAFSGTRLAAVTAGLMWLLLGVQSYGESLATVNGASIESEVLEVYMQNRLEKPVAQVTPDEREALMSELKDIYLLSTQDAAAELEQDPLVAAQLELQKRGVLAQAVATTFFADNAASEDEIRAEYEEQVKLAPPVQYKARHILVDTQGAAIDIIAELDDGADFNELAKEKSTGPSGPEGGDLGWFAPNQMVKPFSDSVAQLEDGAYTTEPVQTDFGWHVILREDSRETEAPPLESVRDVLTQSVQQKKFQTHMESLRNEAE